MALEREFYVQPVMDVARALIGKKLVRQIGENILSGIILETEAYDGEQDQACHARSGLTKRNAVMYGPPGHAYIYFTYGMHWLLNCVTNVEGYPAAVLIRALHPLEGIKTIEENREGIPSQHWCDGPAKLTRALAIDGTLNGYDLCQKNGDLRVAEGVTIPDEYVQITPRIGIDYAGEPWKSRPWRFVVTMTPEQLTFFL